MNKDIIDYNNAINFLAYLRQLQLKPTEFPLGITQRDNFENLEKFVRRGYYGK